MKLRPAIFLDRDGTIIVERDYLHDPEQAELENEAAEGLGQLGDLGLPLVVVSNQSGVGRGFFSRDEAEAVNWRIAQLLASRGVAIANWYMCPHAPDEGCQCRKPLPGMLIKASRDLGLDLRASFMIGDSRSDLEAGHAVGAGCILVTTGHGLRHVAWARAAGHAVCSSLVEAYKLIESVHGARIAVQPGAIRQGNTDDDD